MRRSTDSTITPDIQYTIKVYEDGIILKRHMESIPKYPAGIYRGDKYLTSGAMPSLVLNPGNERVYVHITATIQTNKKRVTWKWTGDNERFKKKHPIS